MDDLFSMHTIAHIRSDFSTKFGVPRQSGLVDALEAQVVFTPPYRNPDAVRDTWSPTVRPPRLGGNVRMGVFATRSPFRPNPIGLSSVVLERVELTADLGPVLHVRGADLVDGTPIFDIKPYIPYGDSHPDAVGGFAAAPAGETLQVVIPPALLELVPPDRREALRGVLAQDPRPHYQSDPTRVYGFTFAHLEVRFTVEENVLTVREILPRP